MFLSSSQQQMQHFNIGQKTAVYTDHTRNNRVIKTEFWYPTNETDPELKRKTDLPFILKPTIRNATPIEKKMPMIILSHGTGGNRLGLSWLAINLSLQGYIVASPDHWGNTFDNKIPEYFVRYWERPLDISFLINQLNEDKIFSKCIDRENIGVVGFSFGGYTSLALAGAEINCILLKTNAKTRLGKKEFKVPELGDLCQLISNIQCESIPKSFKDNRIKAFAALSPALGLGFNHLEQTQNINSPVLIIGAEKDRITPIKTNAYHYHKLIPNSCFKLIQGNAGHYIFLNEAEENLKKEAKIFFMDHSSIDRYKVHQNISRIIIDFLNNSLHLKM